MVTHGNMRLCPDEANKVGFSERFQHILISPAWWTRHKIYWLRGNKRIISTEWRK